MLISPTKQLTSTVRSIRGPQVQTARNIYAMLVPEPESEVWSTQNLSDFPNICDWTAPMTMLFMERTPANDADAWFDRLVNAVAQTPGVLDKIMFELQARDRRKSGDRVEISGK